MNHLYFWRSIFRKTREVEGALESSEEVLKKINDIKTNKKLHHLTKKKVEKKKKIKIKEIYKEGSRKT